MCCVFQISDSWKTTAVLHFHPLQIQGSATSLSSLFWWCLVLLFPHLPNILPSLLAYTYSLMWQHMWLSLGVFLFGWFFFSFLCFSFLLSLSLQDSYLVYILNELAGNSFMIFCSTCNNTQRTALLLRNLGFTAIPLHGQMSQVWAYPTQCSRQEKWEMGNFGKLGCTILSHNYLTEGVFHS